MPKALEILLREEFQLPVTPVHAPVFPFRWALLFVFVLLVVYYGRPRAAIGIGPTLHSPKKWATWLKIVSWIGPGALISAIVIPRIFDWLITQFK